MRFPQKAAEANARAFLQIGGNIDSSRIRGTDNSSRCNILHRRRSTIYPQARKKLGEPRKRRIAANCGNNRTESRRFYLTRRAGKVCAGRRKRRAIKSRRTRRTDLPGGSFNEIRASPGVGGRGGEAKKKPRSVWLAPGAASLEMKTRLAKRDIRRARSFERLLRGNLDWDFVCVNGDPHGAYGYKSADG